MNNYRTLNQNTGKAFVRAKVTETQKEQLELLAEMNGTSKDELLNEVVANFIEFNLDAIGQYEDSIYKAKEQARKTLKKMVEP